MDKQLLVKKASSYFQNPEFGLLQPIAYIDENESCVPIENVIEEFPNGKIWVSKGFMDLEAKIGNDELFILERYEVAGEDWRDNPNKHQYYAFGNASKKLGSHEFVSVIELDRLPDKTTGHLFTDIEIPNNHYFFIFIKNDNAVYGPFKIMDNDQQKNKILSIPPQTPLNLYQDNIAKYDYDLLIDNNVLLSFKIDNETKLFIHKVHNLKGIKHDSIDYISDKNLIKSFATQGFLKEGKHSFSKNAIKDLQKAIADYGSDKIKFFENTDRFERVKLLLDKFLEQADYGQKIVDECLFETDNGRIFLNDYFDKHKDRLLEEKRFELEKEISDKKTKLMFDIDKLEEQKKTRKEELSNLQNRVTEAAKEAEEKIIRIKQQTEEETHKELSIKQNELLNKKNILDDEIKELEKNITEFYAEQKKINTLQDLERRIQYCEDKLKEKQEEERELQKAVDTQKALLSSSHLGEELVKFNTIKSVLTNKSSYQEKPVNIEIIKPRDFNLEDNKVSFIKELLNNFNNNIGKSFSYDEIANLIINLSQSFLTILSGPPGTGKTSTAIRIVKYLGLTRDIEKTSRNFLNISVGRGWTSSRDILGFYNSLKDSYQPAKTGLYHFLKEQQSNELKDNNFLKIILLDEANLSSIEHYWSDFLAMCDDDIAKSKIDLGIPNQEQRYLNIPSSLRFIATINNDDTTEKLSPRLIDRSPIITLNYSDDDFDDFDDFDDVDDVDDVDGAILYENIKNCFNIPIAEAHLESEEKIALDKIIETLRDNRFGSKLIKISHRKKNAISKYCHVANRLELSSKPMDFAISQHILPLITGNGSAFKERLESLQGVLDKYGYVKSRKILDEIINSSEYDFYSFF